MAKTKVFRNVEAWFRVGLKMPRLKESLSLLRVQYLIDTYTMSDILLLAFFEHLVQWLVLTRKLSNMVTIADSMMDICSNVFNNQQHKIVLFGKPRPSHYKSS
jgi:hypothetical protein